jgi:outer membrane receptor protein involved in Fe transport
MSFVFVAPAALAATLSLASPGEVATPVEPADAVSAVVVFGRAEKRIGKAVAASEGAVAGADLSVRPILRTAELIEAVPGMIATQHSGSGKANQYFLRGFNLDHGTDFSLTLDDVPLNFRTHGHGQGYLDVGGLIPDVIKRIDYRKGPYRADVGDFALVGIAQVTTADRFDAPFVVAEAGAFDWKRLVLAGSPGRRRRRPAGHRRQDLRRPLGTAGEASPRLGVRQVHPRYAAGTLPGQPVDLRRHLASDRADPGAGYRDRRQRRLWRARSRPEGQHRARDPDPSSGRRRLAGDRLRPALQLGDAIELHFLPGRSDPRR